MNDTLIAKALALQAACAEVVEKSASGWQDAVYSHGKNRLDMSGEHTGGPQSKGKPLKKIYDSEDRPDTMFSHEAHYQHPTNPKVRYGVYPGQGGTWNATRHTDTSSHFIGGPHPSRGAAVLAINRRLAKDPKAPPLRAMK